MTAYDPQVIQEHADRLYLEAGRAPILYGFAGGVLGITTGIGLGVGMASTAGGFALGIVMAGLAAAVGWAAGRSVAARMRLQAQTALCQVAIEKSLARPSVG